MFERAQEMVKVLHDRVKTTLSVVADLAESMGVPSTVTSFLHKGNGESADNCCCCTSSSEFTQTNYRENDESDSPSWAPSASEKIETQMPDESFQQKKKIGKKRGLVGEKDLSDRVKPLEVDDAINNSTYLARIIWCLGVANLEGSGPLRPADIARMVMSRSPVSLEPPNIARYIRRSNPTTIEIDHVEGSSNFYKLSPEGQAIFEKHFGLN